MRVGVVGNPRYRDLKAVLEHVARIAPERGITLFCEDRLGSFWEREVPLLDEIELDALVTFGGDGTLLRGARLLAGRETPILGVNLGRVGFLTTATRETLEHALDALVAGRYVTERRQALTAAIRDVTADIEGRQQLNTAISAMMELVNELYAFSEKTVTGPPGRRGDEDVERVGEAERRETICVMREAVEALIRLLAPFAPHTAEEMWELLGHEGGLTAVSWPEFNPDVARAEEVVIPVQVNGKVRDRVTVPVDMADDELERVAEICKEQSFKFGQTIFKEGEPGNRLYIISTGDVRISRVVPGSGEEALTVLKPGACFGEMAVLLLTGQRVLPAHALAEGFAFRFPTLERALDDLLRP